MSPAVRGIIRLISRIVVVLPEPEGPTKTHTSPAGTVNDRSTIASSCCPGYRLLTLRSCRSAAWADADGPSLWAESLLVTEASRQGARIVSHRLRAPGACEAAVPTVQRRGVPLPRPA